MKILISRISHLLNDETGSEAIEYGLVLGLLFLGAIVVIGGVGTKILSRWNSINGSV